MALPFFLVNVFAEEKYTGNQLAVFLPEERLPEAEMQAIAREVRFGETSFVWREGAPDAQFQVRIFTPAGEVPYGGHAALGTAFVIRRHLYAQAPDRLQLQLQAGPISVWGDVQGLLWMEQLHPHFGETLPSEALSPLLRLSPAVFHPSFPAQEVTTGLPFLIVPLRHLDAVKQASVSPIHYLNLIKEIQAKAILIFSPETYRPENDLNSRVFGAYFGVPEDVASGAANGCLAGYLLHHNFLSQSEIDIRVEQGYELKRPSLLYLRGKKEDSHISVRVGGRVEQVAQGNWGEE